MTDKERKLLLETAIMVKRMLETAIMVKRMTTWRPVDREFLEYVRTIESVQSESSKNSD